MKESIKMKKVNKSVLRITLGDDELDFTLIFITSCKKSTTTKLLTGEGTFSLNYYMEICELFLITGISPPANTLPTNFLSWFAINKVKMKKILCLKSTISIFK